MILASIPLGLMTIALWSPPQVLEGTALVVWTCAVFLLLYTASTAFSVPYDALGAELTTDYGSRTRFYGMKRGLFGVGSLLAIGAWRC